MTALRQKMIAAMRQRGFAQRTHNTYLMVITELARYFHRSPDTLSTDDLQHFFNHLVQERGLSAASCRVYLHGVSRKRVVTTCSPCEPCHATSVGTWW